nr:hypothetical protein [Cyanidiaceae sp.]
MYSLSLPNWHIHIITIVEWIIIARSMYLFTYFYQISLVSSFLITILIMFFFLSGLLACCWHFFNNSAILLWINIAQAALTSFSNLCLLLFIIRYF